MAYLAPFQINLGIVTRESSSGEPSGLIFLFLLLGLPSWVGSACLGGFCLLGWLQLSRKNKGSRSAGTDSHGPWLQNGGLHASLAATGAENKPLSPLGRYFGARWKHIVATVAFGALFCSRLVYEISKNDTAKCFNAAQDRYGKN